MLNWIFGLLKHIVFWGLIVVLILWLIARMMVSLNTVPQTGTFAEVYGETIHYKDSADEGINADGVPVLILHGSNGNLWDVEYRLAPALREQGFRTISVDRPGRNGSTRHDKRLLDPRMQAALYDGFLEQLGIDKAVIMGHSMGNTMVMGMAINHPERMIAGVDLAGVSTTWLSQGLWWPYQLENTPIAKWLFGEVALPIIGPLIVPSMAAATFAPPDVIPDDFIEGSGLNHVTRPSSFRVNAQEAIHMRGFLIEMMADYPHIDVPFLIVWGEGEYVLSAQDDHTGVSVPFWNHAARLERVLDKHETVVIEGVGHMVQHFKTDEVAAALSDFLSGQYFTGE